MTTMNFAPASTATSTLVVERMPPSMNSRPLTRTGSYTIGRAPDAATAVEIGTSAHSPSPRTTRSVVSRSVAVRYSSQSSIRKSLLRSGSDRTSAT